MEAASVKWIEIHRSGHTFDCIIAAAMQKQPDNQHYYGDSPPMWPSQDHFRPLLGAFFLLSIKLCLVY